MGEWEIRIRDGWNVFPIKNTNYGLFQPKPPPFRATPLPKSVALLQAEVGAGQCDVLGCAMPFLVTPPLHPCVSGMLILILPSWLALASEIWDVWSPYLYRVSHPPY